jgi:hypothetical protein
MPAQHPPCLVHLARREHVLRQIHACGYSAMETSSAVDGRVATPSWPTRPKGGEVSFLLVQADGYAARLTLALDLL